MRGNLLKKSRTAEKADSLSSSDSIKQLLEDSEKSLADLYEQSERAHQMFNELKVKFEELEATLKARGMTLSEFLVRFNPLTEEQAEFLVEQRKALDLEMAKSIADTAQTQSGSSSPESREKARKTKVRSSRKWIPVK